MNVNHSIFLKESQKCLRKTILLWILVIFLITSCLEDNDKFSNNNDDNDSYAPWNIPYTPRSCSIEDQNRFIYKLMTDVYYWYDKVPNDIDVSTFNSPEELLDNLKYSQLDKWSYITTKESYANWYEEGKYIGVGIYLIYDQNKKLRIAYVYPDSPADKAGLKRGDILLAINNKTIEEIEQNNLWNTIFGVDEVGIKVILKIQKITNEIEEIQLTKDVVTIQPVYLSKVFNINDKKIGYIVLLTFIKPAYDALKSAFYEFKLEGVEELILDLRYNRGGRLYIAQELASLISGETEDNVFITFCYNDKYSSYNWSYNFKRMEESLHLSRVVVLTSSSTCSASESIINGLKPYIIVITIGSRTCGKPVGMYSYEFCDKVINPIIFEMKNAQEEGGYFNGIPATCPAIDNLTVELGNKTENMLKEAIYYIENEECSQLSRTGLPTTRDINLLGFRREIGAF